MVMSDTGTEFVTYRELTHLLDTREAKVTAQVYDVSRRVENLDQHGSRQLQRVSERLDRAAAELERHAQEHREASKQGITNLQWAITTALAAGGLIVALLSNLPT